MGKTEYRAKARDLRQALFAAQSDLLEERVSGVILVAGVDAAGKGATANQLNAWMDPRWITTRAFDGPTDEERERPRWWRYWRALPPFGSLGIFLSAWYSEPLQERVNGGNRAAFDAEMDEIRRFEQTLVDGGVAILKIWLHLDRDAQEERFRRLEADPLQRWRVTKADWANWRRYKRFAEATEEILDATDVPEAPWIVVDGSDERRRALDVGNAVLSGLRARIHGAGAPSPTSPIETPVVGGEDSTVIGLDDASVALVKRRYRSDLAVLQARLSRLHRRARESQTSLVGVFEGRDAAGKGGAIRRAVEALDPRRVDVIRVSAPTEEELAHHYLWRFWRRIPRDGYVALFDRSWYGRVLVERVEGLASPDEWSRAYDEIREFERQLVEHRIVLVKIWLDVSAEEQERRFEERFRVAHKRWKLTDEDLRNRSRWHEYDTALTDLLRETDVAPAPWRVVAADDKRRARLEVLRHFCEALEQHLEGVETPSTAELPHG